MSNVIIYKNASGGVSVTTPAGNVSIETVLKNDCPVGAVIVDLNTLPLVDEDFFDAWELLDNNTVSVNIIKVRTIAINNLNAAAIIQAGKRAQNTAIGLANVMSDADFISVLNLARSNIAVGANTQAIRNIVSNAVTAISV